MIIKIDFNSDEAIYMQLCNQIILGIATSALHEGDSLPSVRQLADEIGINMHTVNKAYTVLKQEGIIRREELMEKQWQSDYYIDDKMLLIESRKHSMGVV